MGRKRNEKESKQASKLKALEDLRKAKAGEKRSAQYKVQEEENIFVENNGEPVVEEDDDWDYAYPDENTHLKKKRSKSAKGTSNNNSNNTPKKKKETLKSKLPPTMFFNRAASSASNSSTSETTTAPQKKRRIDEAGVSSFNIDLLKELEENPLEDDGISTDFGVPTISDESNADQQQEFEQQLEAEEQHKQMVERPKSKTPEKKKDRSSLRHLQETQQNNNNNNNDNKPKGTKSPQQKKAKSPQHPKTKTQQKSPKPVQTKLDSPYEQIDDAPPQTALEAEMLPVKMPTQKPKQLEPEEEVRLPSNSQMFNADGTLNMWWFDAFEDHYKAGTIYLFGKVFVPETKNFVSCAVRVNNLERTMFIIPKERVVERDAEGLKKLKEVYDEIIDITAKMGITERRAKFVKRNYAFEVEGVAHEERYCIKLKYSAKFPALNVDLTKTKTISHVFGAKTSFLELFLIKNKLMGPTWVTIKNPMEPKVPTTYCKREFTVESPKHVRPAKFEGGVPPDSPPLTVMSINMKTHLNEQSHANEIISISALYTKQVRVDGITPNWEYGTECFSAIRQIDKRTPMPQDLSKHINTFNENMKKRSAGRRTEPTPIMRRELCLNESALLNFFMGKLQEIDPDVLVGHNFIGFDLDVLLHRLKDNRTSNWSRIGRLRLTEMPKLQAGAGGMGESTWQEKSVVAGRLVCDTYLAAKEYLREKSYSLADLAQTQLGVSQDPVDPDFHSYFQSSKRVFELMSICEKDANLAMQLMFKLTLIPLTKQLTALAGNLWSRTLVGARAERIEYLLLHEFHNRKYIVPDRQPYGGTDEEGKGKKKDNERRAVGGRKKPAYEGGLVLEPKTGLYDHFVLLLDFNSLYPSIIREFNICFTTVKRPAKKPDGTYEPAEVPDSSLDPKQSVLPNVIEVLVNKRKAVKDLLSKENDPTKRWQYDIRQKAIKLTANSMYGCLGFSHSRFYCQAIAELITRKGRDTLKDTVEIIKAKGRDVIYGDTDSVMVLTTETEPAPARKIGQELIKHIRTSKNYKYLDLEIDGMFSRILLLRKKKYAAIAVTPDPSKGADAFVSKIEQKGLDMVRRDWCGLSQEVSKYVLEQLLSGKPHEEIIEAIRNHLMSIAADVKQNKIDVKKFVLTKSLTKLPEDYSDAKNQPHVQVAMQMKKNGLPIRVGMRIPYVITTADVKTEEGSSASASLASRARSPDDAGIKLDFAWYLEQQIHPPITRLCEHLEGTDAALLADWLGLDKNKFRHDSSSENSGSALWSFLNGSAEDGVAGYAVHTTKFGPADDEERFRNVTQKLRLKCCNEKCKHDVSFNLPQLFLSAATDQHNHDNSVRVFQCQSCGTAMPSGRVLNKLQRGIRYQQQQYYSGLLQPSADDTGVAMKPTRQISMKAGHAIHNQEKVEVREVYESDALLQYLKYCESLFDIESAKAKAKEKVDDAFRKDMIDSVEIEDEAEVKLALAMVRKYLDANARRVVSLSRLFSLEKSVSTLSL